jgi:hypothetical protein
MEAGSWQPARQWVLPAIAIIVAAFALGYGARLLLADDDDDGAEPGAITLEQAARVTRGISRAQLASQLDGVRPSAVVPQTGTESTCLYYPLSGDPDEVWVFCFTGDKLRSSERTPVDSGRG